MKLAIIGSRTFEDYELLDGTIELHLSEQVSFDHREYHFNEVISGGARGADRLGARWAKEHGVKLTELLPDWDRYGKSAGFKRNEDIVAAADFVLCCWDGLSRGSGNSLSIAKRLKKPTLIVYF